MQATAFFLIWVRIEDRMKVGSKEAPRGLTCFNLSLRCSVAPIAAARFR